MILGYTSGKSVNNGIGRKTSRNNARNGKRPFWLEWIILPILLLLTQAGLQYFFFWWLMVLPYLIYGLLTDKREGTRSFWLPFVCSFLLWGVYGFELSDRNDHILASRMAMLFLKSEHPYLFLALGPVLAGLLTGMAGYTGHLFKKLL
jgi:hypothetical protein